MATSGHMFAQHYLDAMFPYLEPERQRLGKKNQLMEPFLDRVVNVDEVTVARRETVAAEELEQLKSKGMLDFGNGERRGYGSKDGSVVMTFSRTPTGRLVADEAKGKTVRQLSRLWQYQNGRIPNDDVVETQRADESP
ncbi:uncharacterized protein KY384_005433 [Bacidia gigantensis]|uniref:uncharacterized protein n=1 Tax=Bacidia gigantensis TaxID=2732470 RepID=UPI001D03F70B|nr:uncharacterized protein KY384_005433 [Bacidia gigantensis]KAG8529952.1 hypothetical protein KY384_005433 [Bacidia gigantensis]